MLFKIITEAKFASFCFVMIKIDNIKLNISANEDLLKKVAAEKLSTSIKNIKSYTILKKSIDARNKEDIKYVYSVAAELFDERCAKKFERIELDDMGLDSIEYLPIDKGKRIAVVGSGPAGLFCALTLIKRGATPVVFERGYEVERRVEEIEKFIKTGVLNEECNVQFGEGGAGTYSDGKLNTGTKSPYIKAVLKEFVNFGAPEEILYLNKPHIGTDILQTVVKNMREYIIANGGKFFFGTKITSFTTKDGKLDKLKFTGEHNGEEHFDCAVFAIGHSSRDTFEMLLHKGVLMERKPFSVGVRAEHLQTTINKAQYGIEYSPYLPPADYKLAAKASDGRGVYSFCMCPGGEVVMAASEKGMAVTNGMSYHARDKQNANAAILVSVEPSDFGDGNVLMGVEFQRKLERKAFEISSAYKGATQRYIDLKNNVASSSIGNVTPSIRSGYTLCNLREVLPKYVSFGIIDGMERFGKILKGFDDADTILTGVETRSSSPVRILRDETFNSSVIGIYPCGEGAGYAGGITSAAVDGIKCALKIQ